MRAAIAGCGRAPGFTIVASRLRAHRSLQVAPEHVSADSRCGRPHRAAYITTAAAVPPAPTQPSPARQSANAEAAKLARAAIRSGSTEVAQSSSTSNEWPGLSAWKASGSDRRRRWSGKTCIEGPAAMAAAAKAVQLPTTLAECACLVLNTPQPLLKAALSHRVWEAHLARALPLGAASPPDAPARPELPQLVSPKQIPSQKKSTLPLNIYQLHNLAHVELNAVDLAMDTVGRFAHLGLPIQFYTDFLHIADDEARHFGWCSQRLGELGSFYGAMPAHALLWSSAQLSTSDITARLALVPLAAEARGLDAAPRLVERLNSFNDHPSAAVVDLIGAQEKAHVAVGVYWFSRVTAAAGQDAGAAFRGKLGSLCPELLTGALNHEARNEVGLQRPWYDTSLWPKEAGGEAAAVMNGSRDGIAAVRTRLGAFLEEELALAK